MFKTALLIIGKKNFFSLLRFIPLIFLISMLEVIGITSLIPVLQYLSGQEFDFFNIDFDFFFSEKSSGYILYFFFVFIIIINVLKFILSIFNNYYFNKITLEIQIWMQKKIIEDFIYGSWFSTINKNTSEKLRDVNEETTILKTHLILPFFSILSEFLIILSMLIFLYLHSDLRILMIVFVAGLICFLFFKLNQKRLFNYGQLRRKYEKIKNQKILEAINGLREIKFFNFSKHIIEEFLKASHSLKNIYLKQGVLLIMPKNILEITVLSLLMAIIIFYTKQGIAFEEMISMLAIYVIATYKIIPSFYKTMNNLQVINFASPTINALHDVINKDYNKKKSTKKIKFSDKIIFKNVSFTYPNSKKNILNELNFEIKKNSLNAIIGESGSGKSTLIDLISGLIPPCSGEIIIDGDKNKIYDENWKHNIGIVTQKIYLFEASIKENIVIFNDENNQKNEKLFKSLNDVNLNKYSDNLSVNEIVSEDGINLSGGERQRLGLARCLYQDRDIIILDEPTNNLDERSEVKFYETLKSLKVKKTLIVVSHNKKLVSFCDKVLFVEDSKIKIKNS